MNPLNSFADVAALPARLSIFASAPCQRPSAAGDRHSACTISQAVVAIAFGHHACDAPDGAPPPMRPRAAAFARQIAMYLAHVGFGVSMAEIGRAFGRDRTTVLHACHVIEDRRDNPRFNDLLDHLEEAAVALSVAARIHRQV